MKLHPTILLFAVALVAMGAAGTIYYETLPGLVIKHPVTGATTATINGTNGTVTAGFFVGDGSGLTGLPSGSAIPGTLVTNGTAISSGDLLAAGTASTNVAKATSANVQAALGQVYQGTNTVLTSWAGIPATSAGVQGVLGQVYEATNTALKLTGGTLSGTLGFSGTSELFNLPSLTTVQKNAASSVAGSMVYDSDLGRVQAYDGAAWHSRVRLDGDTMTGALTVQQGAASSLTISNTASQVGLAVNGFAGQAAAISTFGAGGTNYTYVTNNGYIYTPELHITSGPNIGSVYLSANEWIQAYSGTMNINVSGVVGASVSQTAVNMRGSQLGFGGYSTPDCIVGREGAAIVQIGADAASPIAQTLKSCDGSGTDKNGGSLTLEGGQSTGTGRGGGVVMRTSTTSTTGSSANAYQDRARYVPKFIDLTDNTATTLFTVSLPATNVIGIQFICTVQASDGTDFQSLTTPVTVDAVAKTTTITTVVTPTAAQTAVAASSAATLSVTYTVVDAGSNVLAVKATADTSFGSPTYLRAKIVMTAINGIGAGWSITEI